MTAKPHPKDSVYEAAMRHISETSPMTELQSPLKDAGRACHSSALTKSFFCVFTVNFVYWWGQLRAKVGRWTSPAQQEPLYTRRLRQLRSSWASTKSEAPSKCCHKQAPQLLPVKTYRHGGDGSGEKDVTWLKQGEIRPSLSISPLLLFKWKCKTPSLT